MNDLEIQALDSVNTPVFALEPDSDGRPVYVAFNETAREAANFSLSQIIGKTAIELYPGDFGQVAYRHQCQVLASGKPATYELALPLAGQNRFVRTYLKPLVDPAGRIYRLVGTSQDISAEKSIREAQASSVVLDSELENFVNMAAHDLRSPIRHVRLLTEMLREDLPELDEGQSALLSRLEIVAEKALLLISDVLSHAQATSASPSIEDFELSTLCGDIMQMLDPNNTHIIEVENRWIIGDKTATLIVLRNLIDNAIKHNSDRSVKLTVSARTADADHYQVVIADDGAGFPDPAIAFLESQEFRHESGFGLFGVSRLVKARNGTISAKNNSSGPGAVITLTLPGSVQRNLEAHSL